MQQLFLMMVAMSISQSSALPLFIKVDRIAGDRMILLHYEAERRTVFYELVLGNN